MRKAGRHPFLRHRVCAGGTVVRDAVGAAWGERVTWGPSPCLLNPPAESVTASTKHGFSGNLKGTPAREKVLPRR